MLLQLAATNITHAGDVIRSAVSRKGDGAVEEPPAMKCFSRGHLKLRYFVSPSAFNTPSSSTVLPVSLLTTPNPPW